MSSCFDVKIENKIAHIVLNRPEAFNSMPRAFWNELPEIVRDIDDNAKARIIVVSSTGKHFTAGMDLSVFTDGDGVAASGGDQYARAEAFRPSVGSPAARPAAGPPFAIPRRGGSAERAAAFRRRDRGGGSRAREGDA